MTVMCWKNLWNYSVIWNEFAQKGNATNACYIFMANGETS